VRVCRHWIRGGLAKFAKTAYACGMGTMNISLPDALKDFVDEQVKRGYGTSSEYVRELIRKDQERLHLRELLLAGAASAPAARADSGYFKRLRSRVRRARASGARR
jgi:antitoxin ParD1/3/4